ncbi:hypothetical protein [Methylobacter sp.]|uniref:hypothetical protein n=1 Tax=Methylobacter sp. TaxID=2051955 RepID=UPI0012187222|nr:hypothetical protein [Methylobacter sp.]TAK59505.1 MAG: hypothetical protein EPO18_20300 [Methylobacter sp.]
MERINVVMLCTDGNVRKGCVVQERFGEVNVRYSFVTGSGYFTGGYAKKVKGRWIDVAGPPTLKDGRWRQP